MKMADFNQHIPQAGDVAQSANGSMQRHTTNGLPSAHIMPNSYQHGNYPTGVMKPVPVMPNYDHQQASQNYSANSQMPNYTPPPAASFAPVQAPMPNYPMGVPSSTTQQMGPPKPLPPANFQASNMQRPPLPDMSRGQGPMQNGPASQAGQFPPRMPGPQHHPGYGAPPLRNPHLANVRPSSAVATTGASPTPSDSKTNSSMGTVNAKDQLRLPCHPNYPNSPSSLSPASACPSEPTSCKSSRNPSPISTQRYDAMEGQFALGPSPPSSMPAVIPPQPTSSAMHPAASAGTPPMMYAAGNANMARSPFTATASGGTTPGSILPPVSSAHAIQPISSAGQQTNPPSFTNYMPSPAMNSPAQGSAMQPPAASAAYAGAPVPHSVSAAPLQDRSLPPPMGVRPTIANTRRQYPQQPAYQQSPAPVPADSHYPPGQPPTGSAPPNMANSGYPQHTVNSSTNTHPVAQNNTSYGPNQLTQQMSYFGFQGAESLDMMQHRNILPSVPVEAPSIVIPHHDYKDINCSPDVFRCTLTKIPGTQSLLQKSRLPLGILIHPFKDLTNLPVIQCTTIVRCRSCRTYINPFVYFVDNRRWKCNICFRVNELPEEFLYDPVSKSYGDPARRPEVKSATIEFIAPSEYMLRPPQPAVYLFVMDVSFGAVESNYLKVFCDTMLDELEKLPGDSRTQVGFITFDSSLHFYNLAESLSQPQMMIVSDVEDAFLPCPDNLLVNLQECKENVQDLLRQLPIKFLDNHNPDSALGAALQAAMKLMSPTGGRVTVFQGSIPNYGPGQLKRREDPNQRASKDVQNVGPANDFYKKLSLDCSSHQISVDLFVVASQYVDIATIGCVSKYSGGCIHYYPGFHAQSKGSEMERLEKDLRRYLTRKIGFEAVMRIRCTKGLAIHTFHGNFFVRSPDLLSLPNINPDAGFGMQITIEEQLTEANLACFQAALLYTSSKGERRIRVHTLCMSVTGLLNEVMNGADQQAIVGLLAKMAVDRTLISSLSDAREAMMNACIDPLNIYRTVMSGGSESLMAPTSLKLLPLYILALLKHPAFRVGTSTKLDERVFAMNQMKTLPLDILMLSIYPDLYPIHSVDDKKAIQVDDKLIPQPPLLQLSSEKIDSHGAYLLDTGDNFYLYVCRAINDSFCQNVLRASNFANVDDHLTELPELETPQSELVRNFISYLQSTRPFKATFHIIREDSKLRHLFVQHLIEDRSESAFSYYELLQHVKQQIHK